MIKKISFVLLFLVYFVGGINHFISPETYIPLIPPYLVYLSELNVLSGIAEIILAIGLLLPTTRKFACYGIVAMLIAFLPAHIYFIQMGSCISDSICFSPWVAWVRLVIIHPILIYWAFKNLNFTWI